MGNRYHYDRNGNLKGWSSNEPPRQDDNTWVIIVVLILFLALFGGC
jgi:hypothetical protein